MADTFAVRLAKANLTTKTDIADFVKVIDFDNNQRCRKMYWLKIN